MPKPSCILMYGRNSDLLEIRSLVLESAGFVVKTVSGPSAAVQAFIDESIDLALLCHTLSTEECRAILAAVHSSQPEAKVLMLHVGRQGCTPTDSQVAISIFDGPRNLIAKVREMTVEEDMPPSLQMVANV